MRLKNFFFRIVLIDAISYFVSLLDSYEKVNYNDKRMTETPSNAYFKPSVQQQTVSSLEKEAGFLHMIGNAISNCCNKDNSSFECWEILQSEKRKKNRNNQFPVFELKI